MRNSEGIYFHKTFIFKQFLFEKFKQLHNFD